MSFVESEGQKSFAEVHNRFALSFILWFTIIHFIFGLGRCLTDAHSRPKGSFEACNVHKLLANAFRRFCPVHRNDILHFYDLYMHTKLQMVHRYGPILLCCNCKSGKPYYWYWWAYSQGAFEAEFNSIKAKTTSQGGHKHFNLTSNMAYCCFILKHIYLTNMYTRMNIYCISTISCILTILSTLKPHPIVCRIIDIILVLGDLVRIWRLAKCNPEPSNSISISWGLWAKTGGPWQVSAQKNKTLVVYERTNYPSIL